MKKLLILIIFTLILFSGCNYNQTDLDKNNTKNQLNENTNKEKEIIVNEMMKNHSNNNEILEIKNEKDILKEKELEEANTKFKELYNITNTSQTIKINNTNNNWYKPTPNTSWQWQLSGKIDTSYDVDMYDVDLEQTPQNVINDLHARDIKVICYFSAGSWEEYRNDANDFPKEVLGKVLDGWPDEKWLDISNYESFSHIIEKRLDLATQKNCDRVEPDNVDGYTNENGFNLTYTDQLEYNIWLAEEAHKKKPLNCP